MVVKVLDEPELARGVRALTRRDPDLARLTRAYGPPPLWARTPGFATLIHIILEQQVSLASARAAFDRLRAACRGTVTPRRLLRFEEAEMKAIGFSRQKTGYARALARTVLAGALDLEALTAQSEAEVRAALTAQKGLGPWSADIYLLMALRRPDVWPPGDLALAVAAQRAQNLPRRPTSAELTEYAARWSPWRAVAARILWHAYLSDPARRAG